MFRLTTLGRLSIEGALASGAGEVRPRRLAFLAILAAAGPNGLTREQVAGILWAEREPERARHSLSQALYGLKRDLGTDVVLISTSLRLDSTKITSDVEDFREAVATKRWEQAAELFNGPFLAGFYLTEAPAFERWVEEERAALMHVGLRSIEACARQAGRDGQRARASAQWRRLVKLDPINGAFALAYAEALLALGDRAGALLHAQSHADLVRRELHMEPDAGVLALIASLRDDTVRRSRGLGRPRSGSGIRFALRVSDAVRQSVPVLRPSSWRYWSRKAWLLAGGVLLATALGAMAWRESVSWRRHTIDVPRPDADSRSPVARRLYDDGLRAFYQFDAAEASRLFNAAVEEDSTLAMAAYFAWRAEAEARGPRELELAKRAAALAADARDRDRALILEDLAASRWDVRALPAAESLLTRFPNDPDVLQRAADVIADLPRAAAYLNRAIALDSAIDVAAVPCRMCGAFRALSQRYEWADSSNRALETTDRWSALRPDDYQPWLARADILIGLGRRRAAEAALHRADSLGAPRSGDAETALVRHLRLDDVDSANTICGAKLGTADPTAFVRFRWLCTINLRMQGRYREALGLVHDGRVPNTGIVRGNAPLDRAQAAILDMEMGRSRAAAAEFASLGADTTRIAPAEGLVAPNGAWELTLGAAALVTAGDTVRVRSLVDSIELIGHRSLYPRDPLLHHFLRGLLLAVAGEHERAVPEFRAALVSPAHGLTRINYEMAKSLLALSRPREAIAVLQSALRGGVDGSALYLTRTTVHELLARAFVAEHQPDSAAAHYAIVDRSWQSADSAFAPRQTPRARLLRNTLRARY